VREEVAAKAEAEKRAVLEAERPSWEAALPGSKQNGHVPSMPADHDDNENECVSAELEVGDRCSFKRFMILLENIIAVSRCS
jgi:hypothetical protein